MHIYIHASLHSRNVWPNPESVPMFGSQVGNQM